MTRGRPVKSEIRQNIIDILYYMKKGYGYDIYKVYKAVFPKCTNEVIYYHLRKGTTLGEFVVHGVREEKGDFSWGPVTQKIYYALGKEANPRRNDRIKMAIEEIGRKRAGR